MKRPAVVDFIIVCGFLGSGKTTLISRFLEHETAADTAVIVNDIGEINVDGAVLAMAGDLTLARLANGCVCCSLANTLLDTIEELIENRKRIGDTPFRRFILECSGISDPAPIVRSLGGLGKERFRVKIVCTYSCQMSDSQANFSETVAQLAMANVVVLTKMDMVDSDRLTQAWETASSLAPLGKVIGINDIKQRSQLAFSFEDEQSSQAPAEDISNIKPDIIPAKRSPGLFSNTHPRISVYQLTYETSMDWFLLLEWLENLNGYFEERVLRVKGVIHVKQSPGPILIQSVGSHMDQPREIRHTDSGSALFVVLRDATSAEINDIGPSLPQVRLRRISNRAVW